MNVILYSTGCPKCTVLKNKLYDKNIKFAENNSVNDMLSLGITQVPVLEVDGTKMNFKEAVKWIKER